MKLSVDPGIRGCGAALFDQDVLQRAAYVLNPAQRGHGIREVMCMADSVVSWVASTGRSREVNLVVVERMKIYPDGKTPGDPNVSLMPLTGVAYAVAARFHQAVPDEFDEPRKWKGTIDGIECTRRVRERLTAAEFQRVELPASACVECRQHFGAYCLKGQKGCGSDHVYDAIGIGLKHAGRFERRRVFPR